MIYIKDSGFSQDGNSISIVFDVEGENQRYVANFINSGEVLKKGNNNDEGFIYGYDTENILPNGKQYYIEVLINGHQENPDNPVFVDGEKPIIHEV